MPPGKKKPATKKRKAPQRKKKTPAKAKNGRQGETVLTDAVIEKVASLVAQYWPKWRIADWLKLNCRITSSGTVAKAIAKAREYLTTTCAIDRPIKDSFLEAVAFYRHLARTAFTDGERLTAQRRLDELLGHDAKTRLLNDALEDPDALGQAVRAFLSSAEDTTAKEEN